MDTEKKPKHHEKKVGEGSVNVSKAEKIDTGGKTVGSGGRTPPTGDSQPSGGAKRTVQRAAVGGGSLLAVILAALFMLFGRNSGGGGNYGDDVPSAPGVIASQPGQTNVSANARPKRYVPLGNGKDTVTVMVYMCGTDLESNYGMATSDLQEMMNATISSNVNVSVETGGC